MKQIPGYVLGAAICIALALGSANAQTTAFNYQGSLNSSGTPATGSYDFEFALFDAVSGGAQQGATLTRSGVTVTNGIFSVSLDFGDQFPGANRFLEIRTRVAGGGAFTPLLPRQPINSTPYAVKSLTAENATQIGGIPSDGFILNDTTQQPNSNFNISGNGTAGGTLSGNTVNATTQYNIGGARILSAPGDSNIFAGAGAGSSHTTGCCNAFFGQRAALFSTQGSNNTIIGVGAGLSINGNQNTAVGAASALSTDVSSGQNNSSFGFLAGEGNVSGSRNTSIGAESRLGSGNLSNATAIGADAIVNQSDSIVLGSIAGVNGASSSVNVGIGTNTPKHRLSVIGGPAWTSNGWFGALELANASAIGWNSNGSQSFGIGQTSGGLHFFRTTSAPSTTGSPASYDLVIGDTGNVGIGTTTPAARLDVNGSFLARSGITITGTNGDGAVVTARRSGADPYIIIDSTTVSQNAVLAFRKNNFNRWLMYTDSSSESGGNAGSDFRLDAYNNSGGIANHFFVNRASGNVGIGTVSPAAKLDVAGLIRLTQIDSGFGAGTTQLCRNALLIIATCQSSSLRYKDHITPYTGALNLIRRLQPINFTWKGDGSRDFGFGAEDVAKVEPLLAIHNDKGEIEGVKYDRIAVVLVNAVKEQQAQIESQQKIIETQQKQIDALKRIVCSVRPDEALCLQ